MEKKNTPPNSSRYFENRDCSYYPCHKGLENMNCMFCYCPFYTKQNCPGNPEFLEKNSKKIKSCMNCNFPHRAENYDKMMQLMGEMFF